ncbi:MAG TPA: regulator, partial [Candidatus Kapabacteria bacterium]|nr:regulator [Candidatus Kapabacteria bacterium]
KFRSKLYVGTFGEGLFCSTNNGDSWERKESGLTNDTITSFTTTHGRMFAATHGGLFTSVTNGDSWVNCGLPATSFISYVTAVDSIILVGTWGEGIFRSSNLGYSWSRFNEGLDERYALRVGCLSANSNYLFVGFFGSSGIWRRPLDQIFQ